MAHEGGPQLQDARKTGESATVWFTTWRGLRNRRTTRTNLWMKGRRQEAHIMAQEEGLGLKCWIICAWNLKRNFLQRTPWQLSRLIVRIGFTNHRTCGGILAMHRWPIFVERGRKGGRGGATGKAGGEGGGSYFIERRFHRNRSEWKTKQIEHTNRCWASW